MNRQRRKTKGEREISKVGRLSNLDRWTNREEIQLNKEDAYLGVRSSEGWELFKKENLSDGKIKYYWRKKII